MRGGGRGGETIPIIAIPKYIGFIVKVIVVVVRLAIIAVDEASAATAYTIELIIFADIKVLVACKRMFLH